jgi:hypothetical protein
MGQARVSKVAEREVDGLTRLAERPFHCDLAIHAVSKK